MNNDFSQHLEQMLEIAKNAQKSKTLQDGERTVKDLEAAIANIKKETGFGNINLCRNFPCSCLLSMLRHNNDEIRSSFYSWGIGLCTSLKDVDNNRLCKGIKCNVPQTQQKKLKEILKL